MSYIQPNSTIQLYKNIPIDFDYNDTLYFKDVDAQNVWFSDRSHGGKYLIQNIPENSYVRKGRNTIRITPKNWSDIYACNYMRFKNNSYENKWFYAFVTDCEYINDNTVEISFRLDVIQTWLFSSNHTNAFIKPSYVLRQHSVTDNIGDNIQPEPVETGEYITEGTEQIIGFSGSNAYIVAVADTDKATEGHIYGNVYGGADLYYFTGNDSDGINNLISKYIQKPDAIQAIYTIPAIDGKQSGSQLGNYTSTHKTASLKKIQTGDKIDGYIPKNNKCYTYPYNFLRVYTYEGNSNDYRYEFFNGNTPSFELCSSVVQPVKSVCYPFGYKQSDTLHTNTMEGLAYTSYPMASWVTDTYKAWVAQNSVPMNNLSKALESKISINNEMTSLKQNYNSANALIDLAGDAFGAIASAAAGNVAGVGSNALSALGTYMRTPMQNYVMGKQNQASNKIANIDLQTSMNNARYSASIESDTMHGSIASGSLPFSMNKTGFYATRVFQPKQYIKNIDDFFTMYGYAQNRLMVPRLDVRAVFTYVRVIDIQLAIPMPSDAYSEIKDIFQNGIRFWKNAESVGNFSANNFIVG